MKNRIMLCVMIFLLTAAVLTLNVAAVETTAPKITSAPNTLSEETVDASESLSKVSVSAVQEETENGADVASITLVMTSITAIAAIVAPVFNSLITSAHQRKTKELEIKLPAAYERLDNLIAAYGGLYRFGPDSSNYSKDPYKGHAVKFKEFTVAFYQLLPLIPDIEIHIRARNLISQMANGEGGSSMETDAVFYDIIADIALHISGAKPELLHKSQAKVEDQDGASK